jgi:hypothetical protein
MSLPLQAEKREKILEFMRMWEKYISTDRSLQKRLKRPYHYQEFYEDPPAYHGTATKNLARLPPEQLEGRELIEISIPEVAITCVVELVEGKLRIREGRAKNAILSLEIPLDLFKRMLLTEERVTWAILDERCKLAFDSSSWTYYDGITILEILVCAQELMERDPKAAEIVSAL